jgi:hypothetical protein
MRKQQLAMHALLLALVSGVAVARAEEPSGAANAKHGAVVGGGKGEHGKGEREGGAAASKEPGEKAKGEHESGDKDAKGEKADGEKGPERGRGAHGMREMLDELKAGKLKKADVKARLAELEQRRDERTKEHREELKARFGSTLATPSAREELEHHARRMARLDRALVLAETEVTKDRDKLKERIQKLIDKENTRHEQAMQRLKSSAGTPAPAASVATQKAGEK